MPRTQHTTRPQRRSKRRTREQKFLERVHLNAAGIDIGSGSHWVAVPPDRDEQPVREFRSFTHGSSLPTGSRRATSIRDGVTGCIGSRSLKCWRHDSLLVNARHVARTRAMCPTPVDRLHTFGLLRGSFRPTAGHAP